MINILYLMKCLETNKLSELVGNIDAPLLDINLALWEAEDNGWVEVDRNKDKIKALVDAEPTSNSDLADKIMRTIERYTKEQQNITVGKLTSWVKNPGTDYNYPYHEYITTLQYLIDSGRVIEEIVSVPKTKKRPFHKFVFLCLPGNDNQEWNARSVNKWMDDFEKNS